MSEKDKTYERLISQWGKVNRITNGRVIPRDRETLLLYVEDPLKEAVGILYDKNIQTIGSSCNLNDYYRGHAWISIDSDTLSEDNQKIIDNYPFHERTAIEVIDVKIVGLFLPIEESDYPFDVQQRATKLAELFHEQPFSWVKRWTLDDVRSDFEHPDINLFDVSNNELIQLMSNEGYYYDQQTGLFYLSEEQSEKYHLSVAA